MDTLTGSSTSLAATSAFKTYSSHNSHPRSSRKTRLACDRCHGQKLRCVKKKGKISCDRCLKLKTECRFSPRAPRDSLKPKPQDSHVNCAPDDFHESPLLEAIPGLISNAFSSSLSFNVNIGGIETDADVAHVDEGDFNFPVQNSFSDLLNANSDNNLWELSSVDLLQHDEAIDWNLTVTNNTSLGHSSPSLSISESYMNIESYKQPEVIPTSAFQKLASISVGLQKCSSDLPIKAPVEGVTPTETTRNSAPTSIKQNLFIFDDLFHLTSSFIETMQSLSHINHNNERTSQPQLLSNIDEVTTFLILSIHTLLSEIYTSVFHMMQACIEHSLLPQLGKNWAVILPQLKIGPLIASPPMHVDVERPLESTMKKAMYMLMITMISESLWEQIKGVMGFKTGLSLSHTASTSMLMERLWGMAAERTDGLSRNIDFTKNLLQRRSAAV